MRGMARVANASPVAGDGMLFASSWNIGGDPGERLTLPPFKDFAAANDKNKDGKLALDEFPRGPFRDRFSQFDANKDGFVTRDEYEAMEAMFAQAENALFAVRPGGKGEGGAQRAPADSVTPHRPSWSVVSASTVSSRARRVPAVTAPMTRAATRL